MLSVESIHKHYPTRSEDLVILRDVSFALSRGESLAIMGPSGSGKSTLLNILGALEPPSSGQVTLDGQDPYRLAPRDLARFRNRRLGFIFQEHHLLPQCSAVENVLLPTLAGDADSDAPARATALLERVGLASRRDHLPSELSGGERQRTAIARALINRPALLLADEPTGNLDRAGAEKVADLLLELHRAESTLLIVVTHSRSLAERFSRRLDLVDGRLAPCNV